MQIKQTNDFLQNKLQDKKKLARNFYNNCYPSGGIILQRNYAKLSRCLVKSRKNILYSQTCIRFPYESKQTLSSTNKIKSFTMTK